jgi:uncharacterized protein YegL
MPDDMIPDIVLEDNTSQRLPCVVVIDGSASMHGEPINELNKGLVILEEELKKDDTASQRVQLLVIRLGDDAKTEILVDWTDAIDFKAPKIIANGNTPLGKAMQLALNKIEEQKENYRNNNIPYNRPWVFLITDGVPNDRGWEDIASECRSAENESKVTIFCIGTKDADFEALGQFSNKNSMELKGLQFRELFLWLSKSASSGSKSAQGEEIQLPAANWGTVHT